MRKVDLAKLAAMPRVTSASVWPPAWLRWKPRWAISSPSASGAGLWASDGTNSGTRKVHSVVPSNGAWGLAATVPAFASTSTNVKYSQTVAETTGCG